MTERQQVSEHLFGNREQMILNPRGLLLRLTGYVRAELLIGVYKKLSPAEGMPFLQAAEFGWRGRHLK